MRILIVEDELPIAKYIEDMCRTVLGEHSYQIEIANDLDSAAARLFEEKIDLLLLDLNLNGDDGYDLLKTATAGSFHTIIISANTDKAIEAFQFGVLDFVPKPFDEERLATAFERYFGRSQEKERTTKYLTVRKENQNVILPIKDIIYLKAAGIYVEAHLENGRVEILDKTMDRLGQILPARFIRIHRSYYVDISLIESYRHTGGGTYQVTIRGGQSLPLSRQKYKELHELLNY